VRERAQVRLRPEITSAPRSFGAVQLGKIDKQRCR